MECNSWQVQNCLLKLMNQQLSAAFNAMRDEAQKAAQKRQALKFWTQRSLLAAFNAFRWNSSVHNCAHCVGYSAEDTTQTHVDKCLQSLTGFPTC